MGNHPKRDADWHTTHTLIALILYFVSCTFDLNVHNPNILPHRTLQPLRMERDIPGPDDPICACTSQPLLTINPKHNVYTSCGSVLDRNIAQRELDAPDVDVSVECARSHVLAVSGPREREDTTAMERPAACNELFEQKSL